MKPEHLADVPVSETPANPHEQRDVPVVPVSDPDNGAGEVDQDEIEPNPFHGDEIDENEIERLHEIYRESIEGNAA
jgi:putative methionine-R-sulfoxide reductase with GAF domain